MKLRRIISALIVFTLVMTCAVCSVSADGTYNVTTTYDLSTKNITVNATIAGGTANDMVSYLIVEPVTTGEGEDATTSYDVLEDGSNILHIDQATLDASGNATMDTFTAEYAYLKGGKVKFVPTTEGSLSRATSGTAPYDYIQSVEKFTDVLTGITFMNEADNGNLTDLYYVKSDGAVVPATLSGNINASRFDPDWYDGDFSSTRMAFAPLDDVVAFVVNAAAYDTENNYDNVRIRYTKRTGSATGELNDDETSFTIYNTLDNNSTNLMVNGFYKDDITDGKFGTIDLEPGAIISLNRKMEASGTSDLEQYMSIDSKPIYGTYENSNGTFDSVTFLVTATSTEIADKAGLKITAYPKGTVSMDATEVTTGDAKKQAVELGICPNAYTGQTQFAIQLFDGAEEGYLDSTQWDIEATPVINTAAEGDEANWVELSVLGDDLSELTGKYFTVNRLDEFVVVEE